MVLQSPCRSQIPPEHGIALAVALFLQEFLLVQLPWHSPSASGPLGRWTSFAVQRACKVRQKHSQPCQFLSNRFQVFCSSSCSFSWNWKHYKSPFQMHFSRLREKETQLMWFIFCYSNERSIKIRMSQKSVVIIRVIIQRQTMGILMRLRHLSN